MQFYYQEGLWARPDQRCAHIFSTLGSSKPLGSSLHLFWSNLGWARLYILSLGISSNGSTLHQSNLSPNSYRLAIAIYIMYFSEGFPPPSMEELSHFLSLRKVAKELGYFYFAMCKSYNNKGFNQGRISHVKNWKDPYFYVFNTDRVRTQFNINPSKTRLTLYNPFSFSFTSSNLYFFLHSCLDHKLNYLARL